ncbi:phage tail protein [Pelomonas sp. KK5]|uniref:phage tail protein n=1 Tax=Pelomonas sp. KK5 TaxID=1855730 RepID=UPI00097BD64A|nr:phage tail protein [Pelomonas sp. KK5]
MSTNTLPTQQAATAPLEQVEIFRAGKQRAMNGQVAVAVPSGAVQAFARATAPDGWSVCEGGELSRSANAALFAAIGTTWGPATTPRRSTSRTCGASSSGASTRGAASTLGVSSGPPRIARCNCTST